MATGTGTMPRGVMVPRLRAVRLRRLMKQAELARRAGVSVSTLSALEQGHHTAALDTVQRLAAALGVSPDALIGAPPEGDLPPLP
jgi:transcriptional regulator with XRE-family HTH domain